MTGGAVLSHFSAEIVDSEDNFIRMLKINRNAVIMMDSDKSSDREKLKGRVIRICSEAENIASIFAWVTEGREVENYLPEAALAEYFGSDNIAIGKHDSFAGKFKELKKVETFDKVKFASDIINKESYNFESLKDKLDLKDKGHRTYKKIQ